MQRTPSIPRPEKPVRSWEASGWAYQLAQRPDGSYVVYAVESNGDGWRIGSGDTVRVAIASVRQSDADVLALCTVAET